MNDRAVVSEVFAFAFALAETPEALDRTAESGAEENQPRRAERGHTSGQKP